MNTFDLILYHDIISEFEKNNFKEASILHRHFIKIAQPIQDPEEKETFEIINDKGLMDDYKAFAIEYYKSQPQFDSEDDFEEIFNTYGSNNTLLAEEFLRSIGNEQFIDVKDRTEKGEEIVEMIETLSTSDSKFDKLSKTLKVAIKKGLPIAFVLAGSAKLYYLLKYIIENREEIAKYATLIVGIISQILSSLPPINFTLFNIQKIPTAYEIVEEKRIINVTRTKNEYKYIIEYSTPLDNKSHDVSIVTMEENGDKNTTKIKTGPGQSISEPITSDKKFKSVKVFDNGKLIDSQSGSQAEKQIESKPSSSEKIKSAPVKKSVTNTRPDQSISKPSEIRNLPKTKTKTTPKTLNQTLPDEDLQSLPTTTTPTFNNRRFKNPDLPEINVDTEPLSIAPSSRKLPVNIQENKIDTEKKSEPEKYYLENKPENAKNQPEELGQRKSKIPGIHVFLDDLVENTLKRHLGENVSMQIHEYKTNEFDDVEQFVEFKFPNKKDNFIMEYKLNGNTGRRTMERHPADYFKKKPRFSLPKINLDDEQVQGILAGLMKKRN